MIGAFAEAGHSQPQVEKGYGEKLTCSSYEGMKKKEVSVIHVNIKLILLFLIRDKNQNSNRGGMAPIDKR